VRLDELAGKVSRDVEALLLEEVSGSPQSLYEASRHLLKAGGKRLRPLVLVASGLLFDEGSYGELIPFAASVELIHTFTLIHDDIIDKDDCRRGVPTVHRLWGVPTAIVSGDLLFAKALELAARSALKRLAGERLVRGTMALLELSRAARIVAEGQALDMSFASAEALSEEDYYEMVYKKTGALIEAAARVGALVAGASEQAVGVVGEYAATVGVAFQIKDDVLGLYGREEKIGKPVYSDLREGKRTLLVIKALRHGSDELKNKLRSVLGNKSASREDLEYVAKLIEAEGFREEVERKAKNLAEKALELLSSLRGSVNEEYYEVLEQLAIYAVAREK